MDYLDKIENEIKDLGFQIKSRDFGRPWGGFLVISEDQAQEFVNQFFYGVHIESLKIEEKISPKILIVKPNSKLSWQYHQRRAEIWKVFKGKVGISRSYDNNQSPIITLDEGDQVKLENEERHRLIGLDGFAVLAEIWQHTDPNNPSDENDIIRLRDDYGR